MRTFLVLTVVAILIAVSAPRDHQVASDVATATRHPLAISIEQLHQSLPALETENLF